MSETEVTTESQIVDTDNLDAFADDFFGQNKSAPEKTKPEAAQDEPADETLEPEAQTAEEDEAELDKPVDDKPKKKTVQDRIDEVVRQREEIRREATAEVAKLRQELEDFKKSQTPAQIAPEVAGEPTPDALDKDGTPVYALGEFDPQYIRDLTRFTLDTERTKANAEQAEAQRRTAIEQEQQTLQTTWNSKLEVAKVEYPDLVEKGQAVLNNFTNLDQNYAGYLSTLLMSMDKGPDVLYYLANHPEEAVTIVNSGAQRATLALGRIEAKFLEADAQKLLAKPKVSKAPPPPAERARGTNGAFVSVAGDTEDLDEFSQAFFKKK